MWSSISQQYFRWRNINTHVKLSDFFHVNLAPGFSKCSLPKRLSTKVNPLVSPFDYAKLFLTPLRGPPAPRTRNDARSIIWPSWLHQEICLKTLSYTAYDLMLRRPARDSWMSFNNNTNVFGSVVDLCQQDEPWPMQPDDVGARRYLIITLGSRRKASHYWGERALHTNTPGRGVQQFIWGA